METLFPIPTRIIVAYRHSLSSKGNYTGEDNEVVCLNCKTDGDRAIVLRSDNGRRIHSGLIYCSMCHVKIA